jgi:hypothetical protein
LVFFFQKIHPIKINDIFNTIPNVTEEQYGATNFQGASKGVGKIFKNIFGVSTAADESTRVQNISRMQPMRLQSLPLIFKAWLVSLQFKN